MQKQEQYKALVNSYTQRNKIPPPLYHCNVEGFGEKRLFHATVVLGDHSFSTTNPYRTKRDAEFEAAKQACLQLQLSKGISSENQLQRSRTLGEQGSQNLHLSQSSKLKLPKGSIPVSCVEDVNRHLTDEILAVIFKSYLHHFSQEEQVSYPVYKTVQALENGLKGFTGEVLFKEKTFQCLGLMQTRKQAEQSAAEVCLRSLGYLPNSAEEDGFTIQKYKGGYSNTYVTTKKKNGQKHLISMLINVTNFLGVEYPHYLVKTHGSGSHSFSALCWFEGNIYEIEHPQDSLKEARNQVTLTALKMLGIHHTNNSMNKLQFKRHLTIQPVPITNTPFSNSPSKQKCWVHERYSYISKYDGDNLTDEEKKTILYEKNFVSAQASLDVMFSKPPEFNGKPLCEIANLTVGEICNQYKDVLTVGNEKFSIRMFCPEKTIFCKKRGRKVEIMPGHSIHGLECSYKLCVSTREIYIYAESCDDLIFPNPSLPCLRSVSAVLMIHDQNAPSQIYVLLKRPSIHQTFIPVAESIAIYLQKIISGDTPCELDVPQVTCDINNWLHHQVESLSIMSMDSMKELLELTIKYDERWNEIFVAKLTDDLEKLKGLCAKELERRTSKKIKEEEEDINATSPWYLPKTSPKHQLFPTGIHVEDSDLTMFRCVREQLGLRVKLSEIQHFCKKLDLPTTQNNNPHRGDVERFYLWKKIKKSTDSDDSYYEDLSERLSKDSWMDGSDFAKKQYKNSKKTNKRKPTFSQHATKRIKLDVDVTKDQQNIETDGTDTNKTTLSLQNNIKSSTDDHSMLHDDCQWFELEEAKKKCKQLLLISNTEELKSEINVLKQDIKNLNS